MERRFRPGLTDGGTQFVPQPSLKPHFVPSTFKVSSSPPKGHPALWDGGNRYVTPRGGKPTAKTPPRIPTVQANTVPSTGRPALWDGGHQYVTQNSLKNRPNRVSGTAVISPVTSIGPTELADTSNPGLITDLGDYPVESEPSVEITLRTFLSHVLADSNIDESERRQLDELQALFELAGEGTNLNWRNYLTPEQANLLPASTLTLQLLQKELHSNSTDLAELSAELIEEITAFTQVHGIDLGNLEGKSLQEVLNIYHDIVLASWSDTGLLGDPADIARGWSDIEQSFGADPSITLDVGEWVNYNFAGIDSNDPQHVELVVRSYLSNQLVQRGYSDEALASMSIANMNLILNTYDSNLSFQGNFVTIDGENVVLDEPLTGFDATTSGNPLLTVDGDGGAVAPQVPSLGFDPANGMLNLPGSFQPPVNLPAPTEEQKARFEEMMRLQTLQFAFENNYDPPPDYSLLLFVAQVVIEPFDWVVSGIEALGAASQGNWSGAVANFALGVLPSVGSWANKIDNLFDMGAGGYPKIQYQSDVLSNQMVNQTENYRCVPACGVQLLKDEGVEITEDTLANLMGTDTISGTGTTPLDAGSGLNEAIKGTSLEGKVEFVGGYFLSPNPTITTLSNLVDKEVKIFYLGDHAVIVDNVDLATGIINIRDPWGAGPGTGLGSNATLTWDEFYRQWVASGQGSIQVKRSQ